MTLPTTEELNAEVDRQFHDSFPSAPEKLDPDDPAQDSFVQEWLGIRDRVLNDWTDGIFYDFFPEITRGTRLDPGNSAHAQYIDYWNDIYHQLKNGSGGQFDWSGAPPTASTAPPADDGTASTATADNRDGDGATGTATGTDGTTAAPPPAKVGPGDAKLSRLALRPSVVDATPVIDIDLHVNEQVGNAVPANTLWVMLKAEPYDVGTGEDENNAERAATLSYYVPAIEARGEFYGTSRMQVDAGHWHVTAELWSTGSNTALDDSEGDVVVTGDHRVDASFPKDAPLDVGLVVTRITRVGETLYRVHFKVTNQSSTAAVPAGLPVTGVLESDSDIDASSQWYDLPEPIAAGATIETHLTLEGHAEGTLTATVRVDLATSVASEPFVIDAASVPAEPQHQAPPAQPAVSPTPGATAGQPAPAQPGDPNLVAGVPFPDMNDPDVAEKIKEWGWKVIETEHNASMILEVAERFSEIGTGAEVAGTAVEAMVAELNPVGAFLMLFTLYGAVIDAFKQAKRDVHAKGFVYGFVWRVLGMGITSPAEDTDIYVAFDMLTYEEKVEAFMEGAEEGTAKADSDPKATNTVRLWAGFLAGHNKESVQAAGEEILNEFWRKAIKMANAKHLSLTAPMV